MSRAVPKQTGIGARWGVPVERIAASQLAFRGPRADWFLDARHVASERRIRELGVLELDDEELSMCTIVRPSDGGCLRTVNGGLAFENGWFASGKAGRLLHWEGETALWHLLLLETDHAVVRMASEAVGFEFPLGGRLRSYTADALIVDEQGRSTVVEVKRSERDLEDPDYRMTLAYVAEVCRRCGMGFRIVYRGDLFDSIVHRRNVGLVASRGYVQVRGDHRRVLAAHRRRHGTTTTYGALADALEPGHAAAGRAVVQALLVRRVLKMDLADWLGDESPITIV